jgi:hypothetical protein
MADYCLQNLLYEEERDVNTTRPGDTSRNVMKKINKIFVMELIFLILFVAWAWSLNWNSITFMQKVGLGGIILYGILMVIKMVKMVKR